MKATRLTIVNGESELPILEKLLNIKNRLTALKRDRSTYLRMQDIMPLREETEEEIRKLSAVRGGTILDDKREPNRTDDVLDHVCQLLSLSYLCLGKTRESRVFPNRTGCLYSFSHFDHVLCIRPRCLLSGDCHQGTWYKRKPESGIT